MSELVQLGVAIIAAGATVTSSWLMTRVRKVERTMRETNDDLREALELVYERLNRELERSKVRSLPSPR